MQRLIDNQSCKLYHTRYCDLLNMPACEDCFVGKPDGDAEQIIGDLDVLQGLMPAEGITHLFTTEECQFCRGQKGGREFYAMLDMGHEEPVREKRSVVGLKTKTKVGSMLPVQIASCKRCRNAYRTVDYLPMLMPLCLGALMLLLLLVDSVSNALYRIHPAMPFGLFVVVVLAGVLAGNLLSESMRKRYEKLVRMNPFDIPTVSHMRDKGWFPLSPGKKSPKMLFSKKRMRMGVGTGTEEEAFCSFQSGMPQG